MSAQAMQLANRDWVGLVFPHVPKTAGTTLRLALRNCFGDACTFFDYNPNSPVTSQVIRQHVYQEHDLDALIRVLPTPFVLCGHFPASKYADLGLPVRSLSVVREPSAQIYSHWAHRSRNGTFEGSFRDFFSARRHQNAQARQLKHGVDLLGVTEHLPEFIQRVNDELGLNLVERRDNVSSRREPEELAEHREELYALNARDVALYEKALESCGLATAD